MEVGPASLSVTLHWTLAVVLIFASVSKIRAATWAQFRRSVQTLAGLPNSWVSLAAVTVIAAEACVAGLLIARYPAPPFGPIAFIGLMTAFTIAVIIALGRDQTARCACFGTRSSEPLSPRTITRNLVLIAIAGFTLFIDDGPLVQTAASVLTSRWSPCYF